jgi:hypothetical protein
MSTHDYSLVYLIRHPSGPSYPAHPEPGGFVAQAPVEGCPCVVCLYVREAQMYYCGACQNGGGLQGCWRCGRGLWFSEPTYTDDVASGA